MPLPLSQGSALQPQSLLTSSHTLASARYFLIFSLSEPSSQGCFAYLRVACKSLAAVLLHL